MFGNSKKGYYDKKEESMREEYDNKETNSNDMYMIKILLPIDKSQNEYRAMYKGKNGNYIFVPDRDKVDLFRDFEIAVDESKNITQTYKDLKIWAPSFVVRVKPDYDSRY